MDKYSMKKLALLTLALMPHLALAATPNFGPWQFFSGRTPANTPICSVLSDGSVNQSVRNVAIKQIGGHQSIQVTLYKDTWSIPRGTKVPVRIDFEDDQPLHLSAYGDGKIVDIEIPTQIMAIFLSLVASERNLHIGFPAGKEAEWVIGLSSSKPVVQKLVGCMRRLESTQPF